MSKISRGGIRFRHPAQLVVVGFAVVIAIGTALLMLPAAADGPEAASLLTALFTSTSAVCVTGLIVVDTPTYWSGFGEAVILALIQLGGFGIMSLGALIALVISRRVGLRRRIITQTESGALSLGDVRQVLVGVASFALVFEAIAAAILTTRFAVTYDEPFAHALYLGVFHSVSAYNNAGFALFTDSIVQFVDDPWITITICVAIILGGLGLPVLLDLRRRPRASHQWSLHTKVTLLTTVVLLVVGMIAFTAFEWSNPATLGALDTDGKLLAGFFQAVNPRTAGFNSVDIGLMRETSWLVTDALMFIGGGSVSTAGGIKVTTFALLGFVIWAEIRGDPDVNLFGRRVPTEAQRRALSVALLAITTVGTGAFLLLAMTPFSLGRVLYETLSAFGTVGLSTGITADIESAGQVVLIALMFIGRLGPVTFGAALVLRGRDRLYRFPEERPIIG